MLFKLPGVAVAYHSKEEEAMLGKRAGVALTAVSAALLIGLAWWLMPASRSAAQDPALPPQPLPDAGAAALPPGPDSPGQETLTNGPVHEAYAEPTSANPQPPMIVPKQPPGAVQEMPPEVKPDGQNVVWIPGYWAWDDGRQDYIWVSGIWRDTPPNHVLGCRILERGQWRLSMDARHLGPVERRASELCAAAAEIA